MQQRLGNKVLRQRLRGPALAAYYPRRSATIEDMLREFKKFDLEGFNEEEDERLEDVAFVKMRGKGAPKKKRTAEGTDTIPTRCCDILTTFQKVGRTRKRRNKSGQREIQNPVYQHQDTQIEILSPPAIRETWICCTCA